MTVHIKGAFSDSSNLFLLHKSVDTSKKAYFEKSQLLQILHLQVRHDYAYSIVPIEHCVELILVDETLCKIGHHFIKKWFQPNSYGEMCYVGAASNIYKKFKLFIFIIFFVCKISEYAFKDFIILNIWLITIKVFIH